MNVSHKIYSMIQYKERLSRKDELEEKREKNWVYNSELWW